MWHVRSVAGGVNKSDVQNNILGAGQGSSGETCQSMLSWLRNHRPVIHIWENVAELIQSSNSVNLEWFLSALEEIGFVCCYMPFKSLKHGAPTKRERAY
eukprot:11770226-Alexandrium_andersonii.AAC.1